MDDSILYKYGQSEDESGDLKSAREDFESISNEERLRN
jgi:hypothetical protein